MYYRKSIILHGKRNMRMTLTTLCYIEKEDSYLMLHRIKKEKDINKDKWIGIGGHFESGESPDECLLRETYEETGLTLTSFRFRGIVTFQYDEITDYHMCLYTADGFTGTLKECSEGTLEWVKKDAVADLELWEGDLIFFELIKENAPFFCLKLKYEGNILKEAVLNAKPMELLDLVDGKGNPTGKVRERSLVHRYGNRHRTAHVWITRPNAAGSFDVLLQKRAGTKESYPGCHDISSAGHIPAGCGYVESALRELEEELGITAAPKDLRFLGYRQVNVRMEFGGKPFHDNEYSAVYLYEKPLDISALTLQESEIESVIWMDYRTCLEGILEGTLKNCIFLEEFKLLGRAAGGNDFQNAHTLQQP